MQSTPKENVYTSCHIGILVLTLTSQQCFSSLKQTIIIRVAFFKLHVLSSPSPLSLFDLLHMINDVFKTQVIFWPSLCCSLSLFRLVLHFYKNKVWQGFIILLVLHMFLTFKSLRPWEVIFISKKASNIFLHGSMHILL